MDDELDEQLKASMEALNKLTIFKPSNEPRTTVLQMTYFCTLLRMISEMGTYSHHLRIGQMLINTVGDKDLFYIENEPLLRKMELELERLSK